MLSRRQTNQSVVVALLLERGAGFLYVFATVVFVTGILRGETSFARYFSLTKSRVILQETVSSLRAENDQLAKEISMIRESKAYARKVLRDKYHVTDEDEKIIYYAD